MFTIDEHYTDAEEFLKYLVEHKRFQPPNIDSTLDCGQNGFIFRGQANAGWSLLASAFRKNDLAKYCTQSPGEPVVGEPNQLHSLGLRTHAENRALYFFLETADRLGLCTPLNYETVLDNVDIIYDALNEKDTDYSRDFPKPRLRPSLALAQHHGVPTRLLDWTENRFAACFFAAYEVSAAVDDPSRDSKRISVAFLNTSMLRNLEAPLKIVKTPRHRNSFLRAQMGVFTHIPTTNQWFLDKGSWPTVEEVVKDDASLQGSLYRITLDTTEANKLLKLLIDRGIFRHTLMPSLRNAARAVQYTKRILEATEQKR